MVSDKTNQKEWLMTRQEEYTVMEEILQLVSGAEKDSFARAQLARSRKGCEDQMLPELTLNLNGTLKGNDDEVAESLKIKYPDSDVDLELRIPSLYQGEKSKIEKVDVQLERLKLSIKDLQITLESNLHYILIQIQEMKKVLELSLKLVASAQERTGEELKLYNQGRNESANVISFRNNEMIAELSCLKNEQTGSGK